MATLPRQASKTNAPKPEAFDLGKLKKALEKGHRSVLLCIKNETKETIIRKPAADASVNGKWIQEPPVNVPAKGTAYCGAIGKGVLAGTDGKLVFSIPGLEGEIVLSWNNAKEKEKRGWSSEFTEELKDSAYHVYEDGSGDKHQEITWTITNLVQQQQEADLAAANEKPLPTPAGALSPAATASPAADEGSSSGSESADEPAEKKINVVIKDKPAAEQVGGEELKNLAKALFAKPAAAPRPVGARERRDSRVNTLPRGAALTREDSWVLPKQQGLAKLRPDEILKQARNSFRSALVSLDLGNFDDALQKVNQALSSLVTLPDAKTRRKEIKICVSYKITILLLIDVKKRGDSQVANALELLTFLALQPLRFDHRIINMRRLVTENMKAGNYGIAARFLRILISLDLKDKDALQAKLKECEEKGKSTKDAAIVSEKDKNGRYQKFCYKSWKPITGPYTSCSLCPAVFLEGKSGDKCVFCETGSLEAGKDAA